MPMIDDLLAVLYAHPQVHVEVGGIVDAGYAGGGLIGSTTLDLRAASVTVPPSRSITTPTKSA